jgi:hypothetical protein
MPTCCKCGKKIDTIDFSSLLKCTECGAYPLRITVKSYAVLIAGMILIGGFLFLLFWLDVAVWHVSPPDVFGSKAFFIGLGGLWYLLWVTKFARTRFSQPSDAKWFKEYPDYILRVVQICLIVGVIIWFYLRMTDISWRYH